MKESQEYIKDKAHSIYSKELVELLFIQPYIRSSHLTAARGIGRDTASKHLKILSDIGFLEEVKKGQSKFFINHQFLNLLKQK